MAFVLTPTPGNIILHNVPMAKQHREPVIPVVCINAGYGLVYSLLWILASVFDFVHTNVVCCCVIQIKPLCVKKKEKDLNKNIFHYSAFSSWRTVIHPIRCRHNIEWLKQMITPQKNYPGKQAVHKLNRLTCSTQRKMMEFNGIMRNMKS